MDSTGQECNSYSCPWRSERGVCCDSKYTWPASLREHVVKAHQKFFLPGSLTELMEPTPEQLAERLAAIQKRHGYKGRADSRGTESRSTTVVERWETTRDSPKRRRIHLYDGVEPKGASEARLATTDRPISRETTLLTEIEAKSTGRKQKSPDRKVQDRRTVPYPVDTGTTKNSTQLNQGHASVTAKVKMMVSSAPVGTMSSRPSTVVASKSMSTSKIEVKSAERSRGIQTTEPIGQEAGFDLFDLLAENGGGLEAPACEVVPSSGRTGPELEMVDLGEQGDDLDLLLDLPSVVTVPRPELSATDLGSLIATSLMPGPSTPRELEVMPTGLERIPAAMGELLLRKLDDWMSGTAFSQWLIDAMGDGPCRYCCPLMTPCAHCAAPYIRERYRRWRAQCQDGGHE